MINKDKSHRGRDMGKKTIKMLSIIGACLGFFIMAYVLYMVAILGNSLFIYQTITMYGSILISVSCIVCAVIEIADSNDRQNAKDRIFWV